MSLRWEQVVVDSQDPARLARWWSDALDWPIVYQGDEEDDPEIEVGPADGAHPTLLFLRVPESKTVKNRLHFDFVPDDQDAEVERLLALGATRADIGQDEVTWVVLADPEGNEFCVLSAR
ncbi:VOC family protein [Herbiconiux sp. YIM B11900]|uniref:VOC family protein n=1 Tax=Herbiconiux sp. YIM B11900 TaxID=3404131 RepID=UPI003F84950F